MGGGIGLALACDLRYASASARFRMPAARLGLGYGYADMRRVVAVTGMAAAFELFTPPAPWTPNRRRPADCCTSVSRWTISSGSPWPACNASPPTRPCPCGRRKRRYWHPCANRPPPNWRPSPRWCANASTAPTTPRAAAPSPKGATRFHRPLTPSGLADRHHEQSPHSLPDAAPAPAAGRPGRTPHPGPPGRQRGTLAVRPAHAAHHPHPPHGIGNVPDVPNFSWAEYGLRCGLPRMIDAIAGRGLPASASLNASVIDAYPAAADAAAGRLGIHRPRHPPARAVAGRRRRAGRGHRRRAGPDRALQRRAPARLALARPA